MIEGVVGLQGFGKSAFALSRGLFVAEQTNRPLVLNFPLNLSNLYEYLVACRYGNLVRRFNDDTLLYYVPYYGDEKKHIRAMLSFTDSVIIMDECGTVFHKMIKMDMGILSRLKQIRHSNNYYIWISQTHNCVCAELFDNSEFIYHSEGLKMPRGDGYPILVQKSYKKFFPYQYSSWLKSPKRGKYLYDSSVIRAKKSKAVNGLDLLLFEVYDSNFNIETDLSLSCDDNLEKKYYLDRYTPGVTGSYDYACDARYSLMVMVKTSQFKPAIYYQQYLPISYWEYLSKGIQSPFYKLPLVKLLCKNKRGLISLARVNARIRLDKIIKPI